MNANDTPNTDVYTVRFRQIWMHYDQTYGMCDNLDTAKHMARKVSKDERVSTATVETGEGLEHRIIGKWMRGRKVQ